MNETYLIDTHCHLDMLKEIDAETAVKNALENGVKKIIIPTAHPKDLERIMDIVNRFDNVFGLLGVHPSDTESWDDSLLDKFRELAKNPKIVGIGEIGLDYYYDKSQADLQKEIFIKQIKLANELNLPIAVHDREAHKDTFDILQEYNKGSEVVLHCFSGSAEFAKQCVKAGYYIALGGVVTFKNAAKMKEVAKAIPLENLMIETDAPFLAPMPHRGKENQPSYVKFVAEEIAQLRGISFENVAQFTTRNAEKMFRI